LAPAHRAGTINLGPGTTSFRPSSLGANTLTVNNVEAITGGSQDDAITVSTALAASTIDLDGGVNSLTFSNTSGTSNVTVFNTATITGNAGSENITLGAALASGTINLDGGTNSLTFSNTSGTSNVTVSNTA